MCEGKLSEFNVKENDIILKTYDLGDSVYSYSINYEYTLSDTVKTEKTITLIFSAIDDRDIKTTRKAKIFVTEKKPPQPIIMSFENITMNYNNTTTSGWNSATNFLGIDSISISPLLYTNENFENFDIAIFYQSTVGKVFCAPYNSFLDIIYEYSIKS